MSSAGQTLMFPETMSETAEINTSPVQDNQQPMMNVETHEPRELHDWYIASGYLHFAKDRSVFITYRTIEATAEGKKVIGIGAVKLLVQKEANKPDEANEPDTRVLTLGQVLHIPEMRFNGYASKLAEGVAPVRTNDGARSYDALGELKWHALPSRMGVERLVQKGKPEEDPLPAGLSRLSATGLNLTPDERARLFGEGVWLHSSL